eukprot:768782-Hanusia_phi.AAC.14
MGAREERLVTRREQLRQEKEMTSRPSRRSSQPSKASASRASMVTPGRCSANGLTLRQARETRVRGEVSHEVLEEKLPPVDLSGVGGGSGLLVLPVLISLAVGLILQASRGEFTVQSIVKEGPVAM